MFSSSRGGGPEKATALLHLFKCSRPVFQSVTLSRLGTGKVDFVTGTGTSRKAFFDFFFGLHLLSTAKKKKVNSIGTGYFSPLHGVFRKRGGTCIGIRFDFPLLGVATPSGASLQAPLECSILAPYTCEGNFHSKMTTIVGNRGQLLTSTLSPHLQSPHLSETARRQQK